MADTLPITSADDEIKTANEALYKQNLELAVRNKTLSLLRQLYQFSILALEPESLAEKIVTTVRETLELEFVGVRVFENSDASLTSPVFSNQSLGTREATFGNIQAAELPLAPLKFSFSERMTAAQTAVGHEIGQVTISHPENSPFLAELIKNKTAVHTEKLPDVWGNAMPPEALEKLAVDGHLKTVAAYPLVINGQLSGVLMMGFNRPFETLSEFEREAIANLVDVTAVALDRARLYQALKVANAQLTLANQGQTQLIHILNHQIKGYLAKGRAVFSELLTEPEFGNATLLPSAKKMLSEGLAALTEGVDFVQGVLNASSIERGTMQYNMQTLNLQTLVADVAEKMKVVATDKGLEYKIMLPEGASDAGNFTITGDSLQLKEAFRNLIDNSIKYTPSGSITISLTRKDTAYLFSIADTGVGIAEEDRPKLFTQGGRGTNSLKLNANSTGYGLSFVKGVIDGHHGNVWVESAGPGKGSTFFIELPAK